MNIAAHRCLLFSVFAKERQKKGEQRRLVVNPTVMVFLSYVQALFDMLGERTAFCSDGKKENCLASTVFSFEAQARRGCPDVQRPEWHG